MAKRTPKASEGETRFGPNRDNLNTTQGVLYIESGGPATDTGKANKGSVLALDGVSATGAPTTWYLWVTAAGVLKIGSTFPTNTETGGASVGAQT